MNFPFVLDLTSLMAHAAREARDAVAERKSGKINLLGATQYDLDLSFSVVIELTECLSKV